MERNGIFMSVTYCQSDIFAMVDMVDLDIIMYLMNDKCEIQPDVLHADTQGQSTTVFGLSALLGIELMPRIRNWKDLKMFRPTPEDVYKHIDGLFTTDKID
jgi:TnpA family transposase